MEYKILAKIDTREKMEISSPYGDRFVGVSGTGDAHACDMCGSKHEIHWIIENAQQERLTVGGGCAKKAGLRKAMDLFEAYQELATLAPPYQLEIGRNGSNYTLNFTVGTVVLYTECGYKHIREALTKKWTWLSNVAGRSICTARPQSVVEDFRAYFRKRTALEAKIKRLTTESL